MRVSERRQVSVNKASGSGERAGRFSSGARRALVGSKVSVHQERGKC